MSGGDLGSVALELAGLPDLPRKALVEHWAKVYGQPPPKGTSRKLLERSAAYQIQARCWGDLSDRTRRVLLQATAIKDQSHNRRRLANRASLRPGMRLVRDWNGRTHTIEVIDNGFAWNGKTYRSLSAVAFAITGARWSGPRFFGL